MPAGGGGALTFVAVTDGIEVDVILVVADEEQAEPRVKGVDGNDEEDADDVALLVGDGIGAQVQVDLGGRNRVKGAAVPIAFIVQPGQLRGFSEGRLVAMICVGSFWCKYRQGKQGRSCG